MRETWDWPSAMQKVARAFDGPEGVFLQLGDSLTLAAPNTRWVRRGTGHSREVRVFLKWAHAGEKNDRDGWHLAFAAPGPDRPQKASFTAAIGCSAQYLLTGEKRLRPLNDLIAKYNPQLAVYAMGISDIIRQTPLPEYLQHVETALDLLTGNGTVPILSTVTPQRERPAEVRAMNCALRELAARRRLPLLDIYAEMESRHPDVFSFLETDGTHLTSRAAEGPPTEQNFLQSGYLLRCWATVRQGMEVKAHVLNRP